jgi:deoxyhypusine monooxygenase
MCVIPEDDGKKYKVESLKKVLLDEDAPIGHRTRIVFLLRQIGSHAAIDVLAEAMASKSVLLGHEVAFVLGQMRNPYIIPTLIKVLKDTSYHPVVRHEAAEALGAIGDVTVLDILKDHCDDPCVEVAHTCQIAVDRVQFIAEHPGWDDSYSSGYHTIDPAPPAEQDDVAQLEQMLMDTSLSLFQRYRAMFKLRDINTEAAVLALAKGFQDASPVLRHEIAYVFGMIQHPASAPSLEASLRDCAEHCMVRHEAAEALGSLAEQVPTVMDLLREFQADPDRVVKESCDVALDIADYWMDEDAFESAETEQVVV